MEFLLNYGLFLAKILTFAVAVIVVLVIAKSATREENKGELEIVNLTEKNKHVIETMESHLLNDEALKLRHKAKKKEDKAKAKQQKEAAKKAAENNEAEQNSESKAHMFVLDFKGSIDAREVTSLREEISAILAVAKPEDEVLVRLESGGGMVHAYGLASSQLERIKQAGIPLTVTVDKIAASGGYMMACVANKIVAAPFAIIGSIGVIAQIPNFNKVLKKHDIEFEQLTAGEYKRTLTMFGENTDKAREKFVSELEDVHGLFKDFITQHRQALDIEQLATGEHWHAKQALPLGLIDEIATSDELIARSVQEKEVLSVRFVQRKKLVEKISGAAVNSVDSLLLKWINRGQRPLV